MLEMRFSQLNMKNTMVKNDLMALLHGQGIELDQHVDSVYGVYDGKELVGTGSIAGNTLRSIAIKKDYHGGSVVNKLISELINTQYRRGQTHLFLYSKYESFRSFTHLGFYKVAEVAPQIVLMENKSDGLKKYLDHLSQEYHPGKAIASVVVNGNPFTLGHLKLIETAAKESDWLHVFVVWEDKSLFPNDVRFNLIVEGTRHIKNISIHKGQDYIISNATFPTYFLKSFDDQVAVHAKLDLTLFGKSIGPTLMINKRYVGEENYCEVTRFYNETMKQSLPLMGIEVLEMTRKKKDEEIISASNVRKYIREDEWEQIKKIVPESTYNYLLSKEAQPIIKAIKEKKTRH